MGDEVWRRELRPEFPLERCKAVLAGNDERILAAAHSPINQSSAVPVTNAPESILVNTNHSATLTTTHLRSQDQLRPNQHFGHSSPETGPPKPDPHFEW